MSPDRIARLLPVVYQQSELFPLGAYLAAMAGLHQPTEDLLDQLDAMVDPLLTQERFLPMLSRWLDCEHYLDWPGGRPGEGTARFAAGTLRWRLLLAAAPRLRRERGRPATLLTFLEIATGVSGFAMSDECPFEVRIDVPAAAAPYRALVARIVADERPAFVTFVLNYAGGAGDG